MHTLNLGILAHVDAGKTSLTERLLHAVGITDELGSVDAGSTRTDTLAQERRRGITIRSAVVSFEVRGVTVDLIDTPGHPDFVAEIERVLGVLDGVVLVVSAVEGVQAQTRLLMRTLQRLGLPTLLFVNKIDRAGARPDEVVAEVRRRLTADVVPLGIVHDAGTAHASYRPTSAEESPEAMLDVLTRRDDGLLTDYVAGLRLSRERLTQALATQTRAGGVHPLLFGSARTGAGTDDLLTAITSLLPVTQGDPHAPASGTVFAIERGPAGERLAWVRMYDGTVRVRDRLAFPTADGTDRVTAVELTEHGLTTPAQALAAGRIGRLHGLQHARIGDPVGVRRPGASPAFAPPTLETVVDPVHDSERSALHSALTRVTEQDPMVALRVDEARGELSVMLYGEVQKQVLADTLSEEYGVEVGFRATTMVCVERVTGVGASAEWIDDDANPFLAGLGLRVEPAVPGSGVALRLEVELGSMPPAFFSAVEAGVREVLHAGVRGWEVPDATVVLTSSQYYPRQSHAHGTFDKSMSTTASDFRLLAPLVLMTALIEAGTEVLQPVHAVRLDVPADALSPVLSLVARLRGQPGPAVVAYDEARLECAVPAVAVAELQQQLPHLTRGEGLLESRFDHYAPVTAGVVPERERTDDDPRQRRDYLLASSRRVGRTIF